MAHQPVGDTITLTTGTGSTRGQFTVQSDTLRVVPVSQNVHVAIGTTATATTTDYFVVAGSSATLNLGRASSSRVVGVATGAATVISLPEGMGNPFNIDDVLTISGITGATGFNTTAKVLSIEEPRLQGGSAIGVFNTKLTVDHDSRALFAGDAVVTAGLARRTLTVAARTDSGAGKMYVQQVQISGAQ